MEEVHECVYLYKAVITSVWDGDTVTADIDCGFGVILRKQKLRLLGIDTPELRGDTLIEARISRDWLRAKVAERDVIIRTHKDRKGKYGRWLAELFIDGININKQMITEGLAEEYEA
jgi:micrococcal nuclease